MVTLALWQRWKRREWKDYVPVAGWNSYRAGRVGLLALALVGALLLAYAGKWTSVQGQESPLETPSPLATPALEVPAATFEPVVLPSISGVVSNNEGEPLAGLIVTAYRRQQRQWATARQTTTGNSGEYRFPWMPAGTYRLAIRDPQGIYASIYYPNAGDIEEAADIILTGTAVEGLDATIDAGGQITGTLTWPDGPTPFNSTIELYRVTSAPITMRLNSSDNLDLAPELRQYRLVASQYFTETVVNYEFKGLAAGRYRVCAEANALRSTLYECFDDVALGIDATDVVVAVGATVADVAIELGDGADLSTLTGLVMLEDGTPAVGVDVEILPAPNVDFFAVPQPRMAITDDAGMFRFDELPYGNYRVRFSDPEGSYLASDYRATAGATEPTMVALDHSEQISITATITPAAQITGHVTIDGEIAGMSGQVSAYSMTEDGWVIGGTGNIVGATGVYTVAGLRGGSYRLQLTAGLPAQVFYGGDSLETAAEVAVMTGTITGSVDFDLTPYLAAVAYGSISGTVMQDGVPRPDMLVQVYEAGFDCCVAPPPLLTTETDAEGHFRIGGLPPGQYKIGVGLSDQVNPLLYAPDQRTFETAPIFVIGNPADGVSRQVVENVNVTLGPVGSMARRILRPDDSAVVGATVNLYQRVGEPGQFPLVASTVTDEEGRYAFGGLVPDIYHLCIVTEGITEPNCSGRGGVGIGIDVAVSESQETTGIDILDVP